ncbi:hypothetical protein BRC68_15995 [Halobacteriales archaeon QH_6_64_20]|nr:MAG: hypothetical protein BRC68_15995 [Halobacteriales archaeon QH_6_64_20]
MRFSGTVLTSMIARRVACRPVERDLPAASLEVRAPVQQSDQLVGPSIGRREVAVPPEDSVPVAGTPATLVVAFRSLTLAHLLLSASRSLSLVLRALSRETLPFSRLS